MEGNILRRTTLFLAVPLFAIGSLSVATLFAQTMTEFGAAAAGATVGGASGKSVSDGINGIFGKLNQQTVKAAGKETPAKKETPALKETETKVTATREAPVLTLSPSVARDVDSGVPAPPPVHFAPHQAPPAPVAANIPPPIPFPASTMADALPMQPIPPPPTMTPEGLKQVTVGMSRNEVLKLGDPSSRVAMFDDGHMVETFSYRADGQRFGVVRMQDGAVAKIETK
jgi:hypothetical protein